MRHQMKPVSHWTCAVVALAVPLIFAMPASAQTGFTVNGKAVSASTYQAYQHVNEAIKLLHENRIAGAVTNLRTALKLDPTVGEAHGVLGMALARMGKTEEAAEQMRMAILDLRDTTSADGEPRVIPARLNLGALYQSSGKTADALHEYKQLLADFPQMKAADALQDRINLLEREMQRQVRAKVEHKDETLEDANYYGNVIEQGRQRWPASAMPIRVYIYSGAGMSGFNPEYDKILRQSFAEWQNASQGKVKFEFVKSPLNADITCAWIDDANLLESSAEGGEAQCMNLLESIVKAKILLSLNEAGSAFPLTPNLVRVLCLHEIGHSLGLLGHSTRPDDVLFCSTPLVDKQEHLSNRDKATLRALYETDVNPISNQLSLLEHQTNGNALNVIRLGAVLITFLIAASIAAIIIAKKTGSKKPKRKKKTT